MIGEHSIKYFEFLEGVDIIWKWNWNWNKFSDKDKSDSFYNSHKNWEKYIF